MLKIVTIIDPIFYANQLESYSDITLITSLETALKNVKVPLQRKTICANHFKEHFRSSTAKPVSPIPSPSPYFEYDYYAACVFEKTGTRPEDPLGYFLKNSEEIIISPSPYLDIMYYSAAYSVDPSKVCKHLFTQGLVLGYNPSAYFIVDYYIQVAANDVTNKRQLSVANAMSDYILEGEKKGLSPTPIFDTKFYCDLTDDNADIALRKFIMQGIKKGYNPSSIFDVPYCSKAMGVTYEATIRTFFLTGLSQGINPSLFFEIDYYIQHANLPTSSQSRQKALEHYQLYKRTNVIPYSPWVDINYYRKINTHDDVCLFPQGEELDYFILQGEENGQSLLPFFNTEEYINQLPLDEKKPIQEGDISAIRHFFSIGISQYQPSLLVDLNYYSTLTAIKRDAAFRDLVIKGTTGDPNCSVSALPLFDAQYFSQQESSDGMGKTSEKISQAQTTPYRYYLMSLQGAYPSEASVSPSIYFNISYYASNADVIEEDAIMHFLQEGAQKEINPSLYFNIYYYTQVTQVPPEQALSDFLTRGASTGFNPTYLFDISFYMNSLQNASGVTPATAVNYFVEHLNDTPFIIPTPFVDNNYYATSKTFLDLINNGMTENQEPFSLLLRDYYVELAKVPEEEALNDLILRGARMNINPTYFFNADYYVQQLTANAQANTADTGAQKALSDIKNNFTTPLRDYLTRGEKRIAYNPCVIFDSPSYQQAFKNVKLTLSQGQSYLSYFINSQQLGFTQNIPSPYLLFDVEYYSEVGGVSPQDAPENFLDEGMIRGLNPSMWFDTDYYANLAHVGYNKAFTNFLSTGEKEGKSPLPFFDINYYTAQLPIDVQNLIKNGQESALRYYLLNDQNNWQRIPTPFFDPTFYCTQVPKLQKQDAFLHFLRTGESEGLNPSPYFDPIYYQSQLKKSDLNLIASGTMSAIRHYLRFGKPAGLSPSPYMDPEYYALQVSNKTTPVTKGQAVDLYFMDHFQPQDKRHNCSISPLFDAYYYYNYCQQQGRAFDPSIKNDCFELFYDYITVGTKNEYEPSPLISIPYYKKAHPDVQKNIVYNFLTKGLDLGQDPSPYFNITFYVTLANRKKSKENQISNLDSLRDFLVYGLNARINPSPYFYPNDYIKQVKTLYPTITLTLAGALSDYRLHGWSDYAINPSPFFESTYYSKQKGLDNTANIPLVEDFVLYGEKNGLDPCFLFETQYYGPQIHKDHDLLSDYILVGAPLKRHTSPFFNAAFYAKQLQQKKRLPDLTQDGLLYYFLTEGEIQYNDSPSIVFKPDYYTSQLEPNIQETINPTPKGAIRSISAIRYMLTVETTDKFEPNLFFSPSYYQQQLTPLEQSTYNKLATFQKKEKAIRYYLLSSTHCNTSYFFDNTYYLQQVNKKLLPALLKGNPHSLVHFLEYGEALELNPFPFFDRRFYEHELSKFTCFKTVQQQVQNKKISWLDHFITDGMALGCDPSFFFNSACYIAQLAQKGKTIPKPSQNGKPIYPLIHFLQQGEGEGEAIGVSGSYVLDAAFYSAQKMTPKNHEPITCYQDAHSKKISLPRHFLLYGETLGLSPIAFLDETYYLQHLDVLSKADMDVKHLSWVRYFLLYGDNTSTNPGPLFDASYTEKKMGSNSENIQTVTLFLRFLSQYEQQGVSCSPYIDTLFMLSKIDPSIDLNVTVNPKTYTSLIKNVLQNMSAVRYFVNGNTKDYAPSPFIDRPYYLDPKNTTPHNYLEVLLDFLTQQYRLTAQKKPKITPFFDDNYYSSQLTAPMKAEYIKSKQNLFYHFLTTGMFAGINPVPIFDTHEYITQLSQNAQYKNVVAAINAGTSAAIREFLIRGNTYGYSPSPFFLPIFYAALVKNDSPSSLPVGLIALVRFFLIQLQNPVIPRPDNASEDILKKTSLYSPAPFVDIEYIAITYRQNNTLDNYAGAFEAFISQGQYRGESSSALFFPQYYTKQLPEPEQDRITSGEITAIKHYLQNGMFTYVPTPFVDPAYYEKNIAALKNSQPSPFVPTQDPKDMLLYCYNYLTGHDSVDTTPWFNDSYYQILLATYKQHSDTNLNHTLDSQQLQDLRNFLHTTQKQGINPSVYFDVRYYAIKYGVPPQNALQDFLIRGKEAGFAPSLFFNADLTPRMVGITVDSVSAWQTTLGYQLPFMADLLLAEPSLTFQFSYSDELPFIFDISLFDTSIPGSSDIDVLQTYYQAYPAYISLYQAYKRLLTIQSVSLSNIQKNISPTSINPVVLSKNSLLTLTDNSTELSAMSTAFSKLLSMDTLIIQYGIDSASNVTSLSPTKLTTMLQNDKNGITDILAIYKSFADSILWKLKKSPLFSSTIVISVDNLYQSAEYIVADVSLNYLNAYQTLSPYAQYNTTTSNLSTDYQTMFGSLDYFNTNPNTSIFSAAAYFDRLLRLVINHTSSLEPASVTLLDTAHTPVWKRRPDLYEIPMDAKHTFQTVVYLYLVNYALERLYMNIHSPAIPFQSTESYEQDIISAEEKSFEQLIPDSFDPTHLANTLFNPPCMLPLEKSRVYLKKLGTSLFEIYSAMNTHQDFIKKFDDADIAEEYLNISAPEILWLKMVIGSMEALSPCPADSNILQQFISNPIESDYFKSIISSGRPFSCHAKNFYMLTKLDKKHMQTLIPSVQKLTQDNHKQYYVYFSDNFDPMTIAVNADDKLEIIQNITLDRLKKLALSSFFAKKLGCSVLEVQQPLGILNISVNNLDNDVKTLALFQWISKTSNQSISIVMESFCPLTEERYFRLFKKIQTPQQKRNKVIIYPFSEYQIQKALTQLTNISTHAAGTLQTLLSPENFNCLQSVAMVLRIAFTDFGLLINNVLLQKIEQNGAIMNWLLLVTATAKLCKASLEDLSRLYHILVGNDASSYPSSIEGLYGYLVGENNSAQDTIYKVSMLYAEALWFQQNNLSIENINDMMYPPATGSYNYASNDAKTLQLSKDSQALLTSAIQQLKASSHITSALNMNVLSQVDSQLCQKLATYFSVDFQVLVEIFKNLIQPNSTQNNVMAFVCNNGALITLTADTDISSLQPSLDTDVMLSLQGITQLVTLFKLSAVNELTRFNDVRILMDVIHLTKDNNKLVFSLSLNVLKTLSRLKNLQRNFQDNTNQFLTYYHLATPSKKQGQKTTNNASINQTFLSYANWDKTIYSELCHQLAFPQLALTDSSTSSVTDSTELCGTTSNGITFEFRMSVTQNDGKRGFSMVDTTPEQVVKYLLTLADNIHQRQLLAPEIQHAFELHLITTKEWDALIESAHNNASKNIKDELQKAKATYCSQKNIFVFYLSALKNSLWLGSRSAALYLNGQNTSVYLWDTISSTTPGENTLHFVDKFILTNAQAFLHILESEGGAYLNLISTLTDIPMTSLSSSLHDNGYYFLPNVKKQSASTLYYLNTEGKLILIDIHDMMACSNALKIKLGNKTRIYLSEMDIETIILTNGGQAPDDTNRFNVLIPTAILNDSPDVALMIKQILWLHQLFSVIKKMNNDATIFSFIINKIKNEQITIDFSQYYETHEILRNSLSSLIQNIMPNGNKVLYELSRTIEARKRDVLAAAVLNICNKQMNLGQPLLGVPDLSAYLLLEVAMDSVWDTSPIVEANNSLQELLNRCRMGLESSVDVSSFSENYWGWIGSYRLWQANRNVLIYPENYLDPSLREEKSPEFDTFTQTISQSSMDSKTINDAFRNYFHQVTKLSGLTYIDACQSVDNAHNITIYLFASMTTSSATDYYYRTVTNITILDNSDLNEDTMSWSYWSKIDVPIHSQLISPIFVNDRLYVFWVETKYNQFKSDYVKTGDSKTTTTGTCGYTTVLNYHIQCTYQNTNGTWEIPMTIVKEDNFDIRKFFAQSCSDNGLDIIYIDNQYAVFGIYDLSSNGNNPSPWYTQTNSNSHNINKPFLYWVRLDKVCIEVNNDNVKDAFIEIQYPGTEFDNMKIWDWLSDKTVQTQITGPLQPRCYKLDKNFVLSDSSHTGILLSDHYNHLMAPKYQSNNQFKISSDYLSQQAADTKAGNSYFPNLSPCFYPITYSDIELNMVDGTTDPYKYADLIYVKGNTWSGGSIQILSMLDAAYLIFPVTINQKKKYHYVSLSSFQAMNKLNQSLFAGDVSSLVALINDPNSNDLEENFPTTYNSTNNPNVIFNHDQKINFNGSIGPYVWEAFFFMVFYVANALSNASRSVNINSMMDPYQNFSNADAWYRLIINLYATQKNGKSLFQFPPFQQSFNAALNLTSYKQILSTSDAHPFDPHAIAKLRPIAYQKTIVMHTIKNLLSWGDALFTTDTRESITEALNLYHLANHLLGPKPEPLGLVSFPKKPLIAGDYYGDKSTQTPNDHQLTAFNPQTLGIFIYLENNLLNVSTTVFPKPADKKTYLTEAHFYQLNPYFSIPENTNFLSYWTQVSDRLYKIYHSENIDGAKQSLALFSPELDVMQLVRAAASGGFNNVNALLGSSPIPIYRFHTLLDSANKFVSQYIGLSNTFLSYLEHQDSERLSLMLNSHQTKLLNLICQGKVAQINAAQYEIQQLTDNISSINDRLSYYSGLVSANVSGLEIAAQTLKITGQVLSGVSGIFHASSAAAAVVPGIQLGYAGGLGPMATAKVGPEQVSQPLSKTGQVITIAGSILTAAGDGCLVASDYSRRLQEWQYQMQQASNDLVIYQDLLEAANIRLQIAQNDLDVHQCSIQQQQEVVQFYQDKFGTEALYSALLALLTPLHQDAYNLAFRLSLKAERAYHYELPHDNTPSYITGGYNSNYKGQLSGESLQFQLNCMEEAYLNNNERLFEAEKIISLEVLSPNYITDFKTLGYLPFNIDQILFESDCDNFCDRRIRYVDVSVPALTGPYETLNLILSRTDLITEPNYSGIKCDMFISTGVHDTGMLPESSNDGRYRLFEGTPIEPSSSWRLSVGNQKEFDKHTELFNRIQTISDVLITIGYTARTGKAQGNNSSSTMPPADYSLADLSQNEAFANAYESRSSTVNETFSAKRRPSYLQSPGKTSQATQLQALGVFKSNADQNIKTKSPSITSGYVIYT